MPLNERDKSHIYDILQYSNEITEILKDENQDTFLTNRVKCLAIERLVEIIGEAANHISKDVQEMNTDIPWSKIIGLRNKIAHDYGEILTERIWLIALKSIPDLAKKIKSKNFID